MAEPQKKGIAIGCPPIMSGVARSGLEKNPEATPDSKHLKIADVFPWGEQWPPPNDAGNYFGDSK